MSQPQKDYSGRIRRILVCLDGSDESREGALLAIELARQVHAEITVLTVLPDESYLETLESMTSAEDAWRRSLTHGLNRAVELARDSEIQFANVEVRDGDPAKCIAEYAAEHGFDLLVIGSHGRERAIHVGLGKVLQHLLRDPSLPVLVVPAGSSGSL
jgi:nucleotide-binding universal stress UspA family protein